MDTAFTPEQELQYIRRIMEQSRLAVAEDGKPYIVWGILVAIGILETYIESLTGYLAGVSGWLWLGVTAIGYVYMYIFWRKHKKEDKVQSIIGKVKCDG